MPDTAVVHVDVTALGDNSRELPGAIREQARVLERFIGDREIAARLVVRPGTPHSKLRFVADVHALFEGRVLAAHAAGESPRRAAAEAVERVIRQLRRVVGTDVALRDEPRVIARALSDPSRHAPPRPEARLRPPEEREIVRRRTYAHDPLPTLTAIADLLDLDLDFYLFVHARTNEDVVVHWRDDGRIGLIFPQGSVLSDEDEIVVPEANRYSGPLPFDAARAEMDMLNHRFLYFVDADDERGKVLYLRYDGDLGLVEPA